MMDRPDWMGAFGSDAVLIGATVDDVAARCGGRAVYLATPYSREVVVADAWDWGLSMRASVVAAAQIGRLARAGVTAISPIVMATDACHADRALDPLDQAFWSAWCMPLLSACGLVYVPPLLGWARSRGVGAEIEWAIAHRVPVLIGEAL